MDATRRPTEKSIEASEDNLKLTRAKIKDSTANVDLTASTASQNKANTAYLDKNVERLDSPTTKSSEALALETKRIEEARLVDDLYQSLVPERVRHTRQHESDGLWVNERAALA